MAKKSGKTSTPAEKRRKASKRQAVVAEAAAADGAKAGVVENGQVEGTAAETAGAQTAAIDSAGSEAWPPGQASEGAPEPAQESAPAEATARPKERGKTRAAKTGQSDAAATPGKLSALDAAAKVLAEEGRAMGCQEMIAAMAAKGYWTSPGGKTPAATLYSAILMETRTKGTQSRFTKTQPGTFGLSARG